MLMSKRGSRDILLPGSASGVTRLLSCSLRGWAIYIWSSKQPLQAGLCDIWEHTTLKVALIGCPGNLHCSVLHGVVMPSTWALTSLFWDFTCPCHRKEEYSAILPHCDQEISSNGPHSAEVCISFTFWPDFLFLICSFKALLLRATFYILTKQQDLAMEDLTNLIGARFNQESLEIYVWWCSVFGSVGPLK